MEFLKEILGEELYNQFTAKLTEFNDANTEHPIKLANLSDGKYVSKDKYTSLETDLSGKASELKKAETLIEELKQSVGKDVEIQQKITDYEAEITSLKSENETLKTENALKFALVSAGAVDVDYLVFKAKEKGEIKLDKDGSIKGIDDLISGLKTQIPTMFGSANNAQKQDRKVIENGLPNGKKEESVTREQFGKMGYAQRVQLRASNPDLYEELTK